MALAVKNDSCLNRGKSAIEGHRGTEKSTKTQNIGFPEK